jgi:nitrogenase molybdenum-iron protein beta chain
MFGVSFVMFPDHSGVLDAAMTGNYEYYPKGGVTAEEIESLGDCAAGIALGEFVCAEPAIHMEKKFGVPFTVLPTPVGVSLTDQYAMELSRFSGLKVPEALEEERGQLVDLLLDSYQYSYQKKVAVFGDPDIVIALASLCLEMNMTPKYCVTGAPKEDFTKRMESLFERYGVSGCRAKANSDLFELHQWIKNESVDLLIGSSYGKQIAKAEDIPFVRAGFPVLDRYGGPLIPVVGYIGGIHTAEKIIGALMDRMDRDCADEDLEIVM